MEIYSINKQYARDYMMEDFNDFDSRQDAMRNICSLDERDEEFSVDEFGNGESHLEEILNEFNV